MNYDLKSYSEYKHSGLPWLGKVPRYWEVRRLKTMFREVDNRTSTGTETLLSLRMSLGLVDHHALGGKNIPAESLIGYKRTQPGEIVMNRMRAAAGLFAVSMVPGIVSPDYAVLSPLHPGELSYFVRLFQTPVMTSLFRLESRGLGTGESGFLRLYADRFGMLSVPVPPREEQSSIVRFLNHMDRLIRRYIGAKKKLIALLNEQKQAIIHRAVTRGLDPNVQLTSAGVEWIGQVPAHWKLVPNRSILKIKKKLVGKASSDCLLLSLTKKGVIPRDMENPEGKFPASFDSYQYIDVGDLVFCLFDVDETPRAVGLSHLRGMITGAYTRFICDPTVVDFIHLFYLAMDHGKRLKPLYTGLRKVITKAAFLSAKVPLPPHHEREQIVRYVGQFTQVTNRAIDLAQRDVTLLQEYRTRLIADVVTGKLDVREAAANLPDEPDDTDPLADSDSDSDALTEDDDADPDAAPEEPEG